MTEWSLATLGYKLSVQLCTHTETTTYKLLLTTPHVPHWPSTVGTPEDFIIVCCSLEVWQCLYCGVELAITHFTSRILSAHRTPRSLPCSRRCGNTCSCYCLWISDKLATLTRCRVLFKRLKHCKQVDHTVDQSFALSLFFNEWLWKASVL